MKLVVARHLLGELAGPKVLEHDEVPHELEEAPLREHPLQHHLELGQIRRRVLASGDRAPRLEPLTSRAERADARLDAVGNDERRVGGEQRRDLCLVGLELLERAPHRGVFIGSVLELDDCEREPVGEQHDVRAPRVLPLAHRELVDGEPVVVVGGGEVEDARLRAGDRAIGAAVLDGDAVHQHSVQGAVSFQKGRRVNARELAVRVFQGLGRQVRIEADERLSQSALQHHVAVSRVAPLCRWLPGCDRRAGQDGVAQVLQPGERGFLYDGFSEL